MKRRNIYLSSFVSLLVACALFFQAANSLRAEELTLPEYQVKAAFLLNFIKFIEWPDGAETRGVHICIVGKDPFGSFLDKLAANQVPPAVVSRYSDSDDLSSCNLVFITQSENNDLESIIASLANASVVTVSDVPAFVARHGVIGLVIEDGSVRFEIGLTAAKSAKIIISSKLLRLAKATHD